MNEQKMTKGEAIRRFAQLSMKWTDDPDAIVDAGAIIMSTPNKSDEEIAEYVKGRHPKIKDALELVKDAREHVAVFDFILGKL